MNVIPDQPRGKISRRRVITVAGAAAIAPVMPVTAGLNGDGRLLSLWDRAKELQAQSDRVSAKSKGAGDAPELRALELSRQSWRIEDQIAEAIPVGPKDRLAQARILAMEIDIAEGSVHENAEKIAANLIRYFERTGGAL